MSDFDYANRRQEMWNGLLASMGIPAHMFRGQGMTEAEWLGSKDPVRMLRLYTSNEMPWPANTPAPKVSERKLRLFACACCRQVWDSLNEECQKALEVAEQWLESPNSRTMWDSTPENKVIIRRASNSCGCTGPNWAAECIGGIDNAITATNLTVRDSGLDLDIQASILRDLVGNPFKPYKLVKTAQKAQTAKPFTFTKVWLTPEVKSLARACYASGNTNGELDGVGLLVLSDALEEAGCPGEVNEHVTVRAEHKCPKCDGPAPYRSGVHFEQERLCWKCWISWEPGGTATFNRNIPNPLLAHLRRKEPHYRGCHILDIILEKS